MEERPQGPHRPLSFYRNPVRWQTAGRQKFRGRVILKVRFGASPNGKEAALTARVLVLLVTASSPTAETIATVLRDRLAVKVLVAADSSKAQKLLGYVRAHLVIVDCTMGHEAIGTIRHLRTSTAAGDQSAVLALVPTVAVGGDAVHAGAETYLIMPLCLEALAEEVGKYLATR